MTCPITYELLLARNASCQTVEMFREKYPDGLDISPLWNTDSEDVSQFWRDVLADEFLKKRIGWAILKGLVPARILADLHKADLRGVNLYEADLREADLRWANLRWADLRVADLREADLRGVNLRGAKWDERTIWPDGFVPPVEE